VIINSISDGSYIDFSRASQNEIDFLRKEGAPIPFSRPILKTTNSLAKNGVEIPAIDKELINALNAGEDIHPNFNKTLDSPKVITPSICSSISKSLDLVWHNNKGCIPEKYLFLYELDLLPIINFYQTITENNLGVIHFILESKYSNYYKVQNLPIENWAELYQESDDY
jgi:hypothetical protein